jgi:hypothetical protein
VLVRLSQGHRARRAHPQARLALLPAVLGARQQLVLHCARSEIALHFQVGLHVALLQVLLEAAALHPAQIAPGAHVGWLTKVLSKSLLRSNTLTIWRRLQSGAMARVSVERRLRLVSRMKSRPAAPKKVREACGRA